jgi:ribosome-associated protein
MIDPVIFENECVFKTSRSSGKGGQHVNKTETKVGLSFDVMASALFDDDEKELIFSRLYSHITDNKCLQLNCSTQRSQLQNKQLVIERALMLLNKALVVTKPRKPSQPTKSSIEKRLEDKRRTAIKKNERGWLQVCL